MQQKKKTINFHAQFFFFSVILRQYAASQAVATSHLTTSCDTIGHKEREHLSSQTRLATYLLLQLLQTSDEGQGFCIKSFESFEV